MLRLALPRAPLILLALTALVSLPAHADRALVIGIDDYRVAPQYIPPLSGAVHDAENIHQLLVGTLGYRPDEVRLLRDAEASRDAILGAIQEWLVEGTKPGDRAFFYYAGHGAEVPSRHPDAEHGYDQTLVPVDTDADGRNMILDKELKAAFAPLTGRRTTAVFDSCHSGSVTRSMLAGGIPGTRTPVALNARLRAAAPKSRSARPENRGRANLLERRDDLVVWSAVTAYQLALEDAFADRPQGVFTRRFVAGIQQRLADRNGDGRTDHIELLDWLAAQSSAYCRQADAHFPGRGDCQRGLLPTLEIPYRLQAQAIETSLGSQAPAELSVAETSEATLPPGAGSLPGETLELHFVAGADFRPGDPMQVQVRSREAGYLTLFDIDAAGHLTQIFPNPRSAQVARDQAGERFRPGDERRILAGETLHIPSPVLHGFRWQADPPFGAGRFVAVFTREPVNLDAVASASRGIVVQETREEALDYIQTIAELLREPISDEQGDRPAGWLVAQADYRIVP